MKKLDLELTDDELKTLLLAVNSYIHLVGIEYRRIHENDTLTGEVRTQLGSPLLQHQELAYALRNKLTGEPVFRVWIPSDDESRNGSETP